MQSVITMQQRLQSLSRAELYNAHTTHAAVLHALTKERLYLALMGRYVNGAAQPLLDRRELVQRFSAISKHLARLEPEYASIVAEIVTRAPDASLAIAHHSSRLITKTGKPEEPYCLLEGTERIKASLGMSATDFISPRLFDALQARYRAEHADAKDELAARSASVDALYCANDVVATGVTTWTAADLKRQSAWAKRLAKVGEWLVTLIMPVAGIAALYYQSLSYAYGGVAALSCLVAGLFVYGRHNKRVASRNNYFAWRMHELAVALKVDVHSITYSYICALNARYLAYRAAKDKKSQARSVSGSYAPAPAAPLSHAAAAGSAGAAGAQAADYDLFHPAWQPEPYEYQDAYPDVNPANGLPMMAGTGLDVTGHVFGTND